MAVRDHWYGKGKPGTDLCPLLSDLDRLLAFLEEKGFKPGYAIDVCPGCGQDHRWVLIKELMIIALGLRPPQHSKLLWIISKQQEALYEEFGGKEGYKKYREDAEAFFARVGAGKRYML